MKRLLLLMLLFCGSCSSWAPQELPSTLAELRLQLKSCDRLVIYDQRKDKFYELQDLMAVEEFSNLLELDGMAKDFVCLCYADLVLVFYSEGKFVCGLGIHPDQRLRWEGGSWSSDAYFEEFSHVLISDWYERLGPNLKELDDSYELPQSLSE